MPDTGLLLLAAAFVGFVLGFTVGHSLGVRWIRPLALQDGLLGQAPGVTAYVIVAIDHETQQVARAWVSTCLAKGLTIRTTKESYLDGPCMEGTSYQDATRKLIASISSYGHYKWLLPLLEAR